MGLRGSIGGEGGVRGVRRASRGTQGAIGKRKRRRRNSCGRTDKPIEGYTRGPCRPRNFIDPFLLCFVKPSLIIIILIMFVVETYNVIFFVLDVDLWLCMCGGNQQPLLIGKVLIIFVLIIWTGGIC